VGGEVKLDTVDVGVNGWVGRRIEMEDCPKSIWRPSFRDDYEAWSRVAVGIYDL
jgi:hypothetical protein